MTREIYQIRLRNLERLIQEAGSASELARLSRTSPSYLSQVRNQIPAKTGKPRGIGPELAERLEKAMGKPAGWFDRSSDELQVQEELATYRAIRLPNQYPLLGWDEVGRYDSIQMDKNRTYLTCPVHCSQESFVLQIQEDCIHPTFQMGDLIFVDPKLPPSEGKYVVVRPPATKQPTVKRMAFSLSKCCSSSTSSASADHSLVLDRDTVFYGVVVFKGTIF